MEKQFRYYLGRITKGGVLKTNDLIDAIMQPMIISKKEYSYTFANMQYDRSRNFIFGKLVKFKPEGKVETLEPEQHLESTLNTPNKRESSSAFIIVLDYMGIVYPHIWNSLLKDQFERYFADLIHEKHDNFFVSCDIDPIVDLRSFVEHISHMDKVDKISATVVPPNPLFGPVWKDLKEYMEGRGSGELTINEKSKYINGIKTKIMDIVTSVFEAEKMNDSEQKNKFFENKKFDISDAAILMAADGYGRARIEGSSGKDKVVIRTKDNQKSFLFDKDPNINDLFELALEEFEKINGERYLNH
ncbi:MAG: hypothetical protein V2A75_07585 [Pseudomonadota bacterium]